MAINLGAPMGDQPPASILLDELQHGFPLTQHPFQTLGKRVGFSEDQTLAQVKALMDDRSIRRIGAIFDSHALGYATALAAVTVPEERLEKVAATICSYDRVTHNYLRDGTPNLWFTFHARGEDAIESGLHKIEGAIGLPVIHLPATHWFKLMVKFDIAGCGSEIEQNHFQPHTTISPINVTERDQEVVRAVQGDLGIVKEPYNAMAAKCGMSARQLLEKLKEWQTSGIIRRVVAVVHHRQLGFAANGMAVWDCSDSDIERCGKVLALSNMVSHCYGRRRHAQWPYNLYAMIHARKSDECSAEATRLGRDIDLGEPQVLFSVREFKKSSMRYFMEGP